MDDPHSNILYLCIDQGGHASRVLVFDQLGKLINQASHAIEARHTTEGYIDYDADELLNSIRITSHPGTAWVIFTGPWNEMMKPLLPTGA